MIIDACSIILLAKSTLLETFSKLEKIIIAESVYKEVLEGKENKLLDALLLERLVKENKILVKKVAKKEITQKLTEDFGLGCGEAESIALALEKKEEIIVTDNKQGRKTAKIYSLKLSGSIGIIVFLFKSKKISEEKANSALKKLKNTGWFNDYLIEEALKEIKDE